MACIKLSFRASHLCIRRPPRSNPTVIRSQVEGITLDIMRKALAQAGDGRRHILGEMAKCSPPPSGSLSKHAPKVVRFKVGLLEQPRFCVIISFSPR